MSEMEYNAGRLMLVSEHPKTFAEELLIEKNIQLPSYWDDALEWLESDGLDFDYVVISRKVYKVDFTHRRAEEPPSIVEAKRNQDQSISFATWHSNGGASVSEMLEYVFEKLEKNDEQQN